VNGYGGVDSQTVAFKATPGERVTVGNGAGGIDYDRLAAALTRVQLVVSVDDVQAGLLRLKRGNGPTGMLQPSVRLAED
jgi:hypothetical protein